MMMHLFSRKQIKKSVSLPDGCTPEQIRIESSICTGEKTIGFYDATEKGCGMPNWCRQNRTLQRSMPVTA